LTLNEILIDTCEIDNFASAMLSKSALALALSLTSNALAASCVLCRWLYINESM
jgi:hypothetical protein